MSFLLGCPIFRCYVSFREGTSFWKVICHTSSWIQRAVFLNASTFPFLCTVHLLGRRLAKTWQTNRRGEAAKSSEITENPGCLFFLGGVKTALGYRNYHSQFLWMLYQLVWNQYTLRIQVCPKEGQGLPLHSYSKDGIVTLNPIRSGGVWILRDRWAALCFCKQLEVNLLGGAVADLYVHITLRGLSRFVSGEEPCLRLVSPLSLVNGGY